MSKLLSAEFSRLFHSFVFRLCLLFSAGLAVFTITMQWLDVRRNAETYAKLSESYSNADGLIFIGALYLIFAIAVFIGIFVGTEYSDGTIRNKLMVGHTRRDIWLSKLIVCITASAMFNVLYILIALVYGKIMLGGTTMGITEILICSLAAVTAVLALASFLLLFSMLIQSKAVGSVVCLITTMVMLFAALTIYMKLEAPEYYDNYEIMNEDSGESVKVEKEKNPNYLTGTKRKVYEFLDKTLPVSQLFTIGRNEEDFKDNIGFMICSDFVIMIVTTGAGIFIFRKRNLK